MISRLLGKKLNFLLAALFLLLPLASSLQAQLSIEEEKKMGQQFLIAALRQLKLIEDPEVVAYTNRVGQRLVKHLDVHIFPYHFFVVDSDTLNAFAAPAGYVFINRGLVEIMDDEGELAGILGHEVAHVQSRHISQRMARAKKLNLATLAGLAAGILLGGEAGAALAQGGLAASSSMQLQYSRQDEEEADRKGLIYLEGAGYQGEDFVRIMKKMGQDSWRAGGYIPSYLKTHPGVPERVNYLSSVVEARPKSSTTSKHKIGDPQSFKLMQAKLVGGYEDMTEAESIVRGWLKQPENKVMAYYGLGLVQRRQGNMEDSVDSFKTAISMRPDLSPILIELGETYFQMGNLESAVAVLESALYLEPNNPAALYLNGRCLLEKGKPAEALEYLKKAERYNRQLKNLDYHLGMAYGQMNELGEAHYYFGLYHLRRGSMKNASFHFQEALRRSDDPARREAIRERLAKINKDMAAKVEKDAEKGGGPR